ncbi:MAG TPA: gluconokinase [Rhizomicrobium sp.]|jgi:carbohydrate kinase (thermoresistant glucokinase family)|nr:gluconokinase [Rhizomicrobium sp.]
MMDEKPLIVVMGVAGSGKTTLASQLAEKLGVPFVEGDSLHPAANVKKMAHGIPLTDEDRWPWLEAIGERMEVERATGHGVVVACSALKRTYRDFLRSKVHGKMHFILLDGSRQLISERMKKRKGHFMPPALLDSQFATLEPPTSDEHAVILDISHKPAELVEEAAKSITPETAS